MTHISFRTVAASGERGFLLERTGFSTMWAMFFFFPALECMCSLISLQLYQVLLIFLKRKMIRPLTLNSTGVRNCRLNAELATKAPGRVVEGELPQGH